MQIRKLNIAIEMQPATRVGLKVKIVVNDLVKLYMRVCPGRFERLQLLLSMACAPKMGAHAGMTYKFTNDWPAAIMPTPPYAR